MLAVQSYADEVVHGIAGNHDVRLLPVQGEVGSDYPVCLRVLHLVAVQRPVGNPPGTGYDGVLSGHDVAYHLGVCRPDIIGRKVFLEIALVVPLVELGQRLFVFLSDAGVFQGAVVVVPAACPCLIGVEEG